MSASSTSLTPCCPCDEQRLYAQCCGPAHLGTPATSAEALMRSRYSAYVLKLEAYLLTTWHPRTRPATINLANESPSQKWLGLKVLRHQSEGDRAIVEFIARFRVGGGSAQRLREVSRFNREEGCWYYVDGDVS